jgi:hypothetical protein
MNKTEKIKLVYFTSLKVSILYSGLTAFFSFMKREIKKKDSSVIVFLHRLIDTTTTTTTKPLIPNKLG